MADQDEYAPQQNRPGVEAGMYIPGWYREHSNTALPVTRDGMPLGFSVGQVLPERRWAIDELGELLPQHEFEAKYKQYQAYMCRESAIDHEKEYIPQAAKFVDRKLDYNDKGIPINFDPYKPAEVEAEAKHNQEGEVSPKWFADQREQEKKMARMEAYNDLLKLGKLTPEEYADLTSAILLEPEPKEMPTQDPVETQELAQEDPALSLTEVANCGKQVKRGYLRQHAYRCGKCKELPN